MERRPRAHVDHAHGRRRVGAERPEHGGRIDRFEFSDFHRIGGLRRTLALAIDLLPDRELVILLEGRGEHECEGVAVGAGLVAASGCPLDGHQRAVEHPRHADRGLQLQHRLF